MITDKQIEAAEDVLKDYLPSSHKFFRDGSMRRLLEAAEAAAWCDDIGQAPTDETGILADVGTSTLDIIDNDGRHFRWQGMVDSYTPDQIKRWRHLPQPPVRDEKMEGE